MRKSYSLRLSRRLVFPSCVAKFSDSPSLHDPTVSHATPRHAHSPTPENLNPDHKGSKRALKSKKTKTPTNKPTSEPTGTKKPTSEKRVLKSKKPEDGGKGESYFPPLHFTSSD